MNRQGKPVRRGIAAALTLLTLGSSVTLPLLERGTVASETAVESHHDAERCNHHHDHRVCTQVGANLSLTAGESAHRLPNLLVSARRTASVRAWSADSNHEGPPPRAPPLA